MHLLPTSAAILWVAALGAPADGGPHAGHSPTGASVATDVPANLDRYLRGATRRGDFNGTVLIARDKRVLLRAGYGAANVRRRTPNRVNTRYRVSSLSTDVLLVALLQLVERGRIELDDSLCKHLRPCPRAWHPITIRLLLTGRSGLPAARPLPRRTLTLGRWIARLRARPLAFAPGRGHDRTEGAMLVGAQLLGVVSGTPWLRYLRRSVFRPAGMTATVADHPGLPRRATPYFRTRTGRLGEPASFPPLSRPDVLYGLASTVDDMYRFDLARRSGRLVSRRLLAEVRPPGAGFANWPDQVAHLGHGPRGTSDGWYTAFTRDATDRLTILAFSNVGGDPLSDVVHTLRLKANGWPPRHAPADPAALARYAGRYSRWDASKRRRVVTRIRVRTDGNLALTSDEPSHPRSRNRMLRNARWQWVLVPTEDGDFYAAGPELWWGVRVKLERGTRPEDDILVISFISLGPQFRYRRSS